MKTQPHLGIGIGWRPELALAIDRLPNLGFVELTAENHPGAIIPAAVEQLRQRGVKVIPHGISLSLGSVEPVESARVDHLDRLARHADAPLASEHIAFVRAGGTEIGHLTPLPRTREALDAIERNIHRTQQRLSVPLALENVSALFDWPGQEMTDAEFLAEIIDRTGVMLFAGRGESPRQFTQPSARSVAIPRSNPAEPNRLRPHGRRNRT